jgi:hypothetical protein
MLKKSFALLAFACLASTSYSQKLMHSLGGDVSILFGTIRKSSSSSTFAMQQTQLCYFPRYNFVENDNSSVSIGAPLAVGIGIASNSYGGDNGIAFSYDVSTALDYNIGAKSTLDNDRGFGGYFGAGFGYRHVNISYSSYSDFKGTTYGPLVRAGVRFAWGAERSKFLTVGTYFKMGMDKDKLQTLGFHVLHDF